MINGYNFLSGAKYFALVIFQNSLVFIPAKICIYICKIYICKFSAITRINSWKPNGMLTENIEDVTKSDSSFKTIFVNHHVLLDINFNGHCFIKNNICIPKKVINLSISYILNPWLGNLNRDFTLKIWLPGSVKPTKNFDPDKCKYSDYGIGFDSVQNFHFQM